jgi:iron complex transport system permease protein
MMGARPVIGAAAAHRAGPSIAAIYSVLFALLCASFVLGLSRGRFPIAPGEVLRFAGRWVGLGAMDPVRFEDLRNVLVDIRLPRVLGAALVGACLATSGSSLQAIFRNPLVSPSLMGVQAGAAFGAALGMLWSCDTWTVQLLAFAMGIVAVSIAIGVARAFGHTTTVMLILGGVTSSALFSSLLALIKYVADPLNVLPSIVYFLMGSLSLCALPKTTALGLPMLVGILCLSLFGRAVDAMAMGDDEAHALGVPVRFVRYSVIAVATLLSAMTVSLAGIIGWVGLIVPHVVRLTLGPNNRTLLFANALAGASFLVLADCMSRALLANELPIGIVTEILGIPVFIGVLHRSRRAWV